MPLTIAEQTRAARSPQYAALYAARERRAELQRERNRSRELLRTAEEVGDTDAAEQARAEVEDLDNQMRSAENLQNRILSRLAGVMTSPPGGDLANDPNVQATLAGWESSSTSVPNTRIGTAMDAQQFCAMFGRSLGGDSWTPSTFAAVSGVDSVGGAFTGIGAPPPQPPTNLLDLVRAEPMDTPSITFLQRQGGSVGAAIQVPGALKAESQLRYVQRTLEAFQLAVYAKLRRQTISDIDGVVADVQNALTNADGGVLPLAENLLLNGDPAAEIEGILNSTGIIAADVTGITGAADKVARAVAELAVTGVQANFALVHPLDAFAIRTAKESGSGGYLGTSAITPPLIESSALAQGQAVVGNSTGVRLRVREGVTVVMGTDQDDLTRNQITMVVEARVVPQVDQPGMFATAALA